VIPVEKGDRRFNIAPPQMERLETTYPEMRKAVQEERIEGELGTFAGVMLTYAFDEQVARTERNNEAKEQMRLAAMSTMDLFAHAINTGDLEFFYRIEDSEANASPEKAMRQKIANSCLEVWKKQALGGVTSLVTLDSLVVCFEVIFEDKIPAIKLQAALNRRDVMIKRRRNSAGKRKTSVLVEWQVPDTERDDLEADVEATQVRKDGPEPHPMMH